MVIVTVVPGLVSTRIEPPNFLTNDCTIAVPELWVTSSSKLCGMPTPLSRTHSAKFGSGGLSVLLDSSVIWR